jgi:putative tricarboxylic transport membrane protein
VKPGYFSAFAAIALVSSAAAAYAQSVTAWKPSRNVEIVVPTTTGGSADRTARTLQRIFQDAKLVPTSVVVNKPGGGGAVSLAHLQSQGGDPHDIVIHTEPLLTNQIMGRQAMNHTDFTPLGLLTTESLVYSVRSDSPVKSGKDLLDRLRQDPASVPMSVGSALGNNSHIAVGLLGRRAGVDVKKLRIVVFNSGGEAAAALLGGHIDLFISTVTPVLPHIQSGKLRAIAVTAEQRLTGDAAGIPTWKEQGFDGTYSSWRVAIGPKGLSAPQIAFWEDVLARATQTEEWKKDLVQSHLRGSYRNSAETRKFLDEQNATLKGVLSDLGLAK